MVNEETSCFPDCASIGFIENMKNMATDFSFVDSAMDATVHNEYMQPPPPPPPASQAPPPPPTPDAFEVTRMPAECGSDNKKTCYKLEPRYNKLTGMTRRQWTVGLRGIMIITCGGCWKKFREDTNRLVSSNDGQQLLIDLCPKCVVYNRTHRFD